MRSCTESHVISTLLAGMLYKGKHSRSKLVLLRFLSIFCLIKAISVSYFFFIVFFFSSLGFVSVFIKAILL